MNRWKELSGWKLTFGKHRGQTLAQVPKDYLWWVVNKAECVSATDKWVIAEYLGSKRPRRRRRKHKKPLPSSPVHTGASFTPPSPEEMASPPWEEDADELTDEFLRRVRSF